MRYLNEHPYLLSFRIPALLDASRARGVYTDSK